MNTNDPATDKTPAIPPATLEIAVLFEEIIASRANELFQEAVRKCWGEFPPRIKARNKAD
jgi:hypothetical protein